MVYDFNFFLNVSKYVNKKGLQQKVKGRIKEICIWETKKNLKKKL